MDNIIVLFEVTPTKEGYSKYLELASQMKNMLERFDGFISAERFQSINNEGKLLSMNVWRDEEAVEKWRNMVEHRMCQMEGRNSLFESYKITVAKSIREYSLTDRKTAPHDSNQYFETNKKS